MSKLTKLIEKNLETARFQLSMNEGVLQSHNTVVVWPDTLLTVTTSDAKDKVVITSSIIASQWTPFDAAVIAKHTWNGRNERPTTMPVREYYQRQVEQLTELLADLKEMA